MKHFEKNVVQLSAAIGVKLVQQQQTVTCAESCTAGGIAYYLTEVSGSSAWFERGFVTYSNQAKQDLVNVLATSLAKHGAVSEIVAIEMANGALKAAKADFSLAVSGIAGPTGGTPEKPVGTVCFAWVSKNKQQSETKLFSGDRKTVRQKTIMHSLQVLLNLLS